MELYITLYIFLKDGFCKTHHWAMNSKWVVGPMSDIYFETSQHHCITRKDYFHFMPPDMDAHGG